MLIVRTSTTDVAKRVRSTNLVDEDQVQNVTVLLHPLLGRLLQLSNYQWPIRQ
jgi:hypothetical protein